MATKTLIHPDSKQKVEVDIEHLDAFKSQGWIEEKPTKDK